MKKIGLWLLILCTSFLTVSKTGDTLIGIPLSQYEFKTEEPFLSENVQKLIYVPYEDFNEREAIDMIEHIHHIHPHILQKAVDEGLKIKLFQGKLTEQSELIVLEGKIPRGYSKADPSWDFVPGIGGGQVVYAKIGHSEFGKGHGSIALELHEFAHSLDKFVFSYARNDPFFLAAWKKEAKKLFPNATYFQRFPEEYFAESLAFYYYSSESREQLRKKAPMTYEYLENLIRP